MKKCDFVLWFWCWVVLHLNLWRLKNGRYVLSLWKAPELLSLNLGVRNSENIPNRNLANKLKLLYFIVTLNIQPTVKKHIFFAPFHSFYTSPTSRPSALRDWVRRSSLGFMCSCCFISVSSYKKMIDRILLLIILLSCVCGLSRPSLHCAMPSFT